MSEHELLRPFGTLDALAEVVGARLVGDEGARWISRVSVDSRHAMPEGTLFVALKGPRFDGHAFVEEAARRGASAALVCAGWWRGGEKVVRRFKILSYKFTNRFWY